MRVREKHGSYNTLYEVGVKKRKRETMCGTRSDNENRFEGEEMRDRYGDVWRIDKT